jgi:tripartite-type tricarboxylate transporter receptor subunit TctC
MHRRPFLRHAAFAAAALLAPALALAQGGYPSKPITLIVPNPPGRAGGHLRAHRLGFAWQGAEPDGDRGQPRRRQRQRGLRHGARAPADGYTLLTSYSAYHVGNPSLTPKLPWAQKDFTPVALVTVATNVIAAHPSVPANSLQEFIAYLKKNPGKVSYASQGNGSVSHIGTEMFKAQTGTSMVHIPYRGSGPAIQDVLSGQVQVFMTTPPSVMQHVQSGKLKAFAVTGAKRHPNLPNVPTTAEAASRASSWSRGWRSSRRQARRRTWSASSPAAIKQALETPEARSRADAAGIEIRYLPPQQLDAMVKKETVFWAKTIKDQGITAD